LDLGEPNI